MSAGDVPETRPQETGRRKMVFSDSDGGEESDSSVSGSEGDMESGEEEEEEGAELSARTKQRRRCLSEDSGSASEEDTGKLGMEPWKLLCLLQEVFT